MYVCMYVWIFFIEYLLCGSSIGWLLWKYSDCSCEGITGSTTHGYYSVVVVVVMVVVVVGETAIGIIVAVVVVVVVVVESYT